VETTLHDRNDRDAIEKFILDLNCFFASPQQNSSSTEGACGESPSQDQVGNACGNEILKQDDDNSAPTETQLKEHPSGGSDPIIKLPQRDAERPLFRKDLLSKMHMGRDDIDRRILNNLMSVDPHWLEIHEYIINR